MGVEKHSRPIVAPTSGDVTTDGTGASAIGAGKVTYAKQAVFITTGLTGTGSSQNVAHGLGVTPTKAFIMFEGSTSAQAVTYGTHTSTNVVVTVTTGAKFGVYAIV